MKKDKKINWVIFLRNQTPLQFLKSSFGFTIRQRSEEYCYRMEERFQWCTRHGFDSAEEAAVKLAEYLKKKLPPQSIFSFMIITPFLGMSEILS